MHAASSMTNTFVPTRQDRNGSRHGRGSVAQGRGAQSESLRRSAKCVQHRSLKRKLLPPFRLEHVSCCAKALQPTAACRKEYRTHNHVPPHVSCQQSVTASRPHTMQLHTIPESACWPQGVQACDMPERDMRGRAPCVLMWPRRTATHQVSNRSCCLLPCDR